MALKDSSVPVPVEVTGTPIVRVEGQEPGMPLPVSVVAQAPTPTATVTGVGGGQSAMPTTTEEQDRGTLGQRTINLIWENTQMRLALSVIWGSLVVSMSLAVFGKWLGSPDIQLAAVVFLFGVANLVTGFYFGRTNHTRTGGVGGDHAGGR